MTSVFDRLAQQGTASSAARTAEEKQCRSQQQQRRKEASAALTPKSAKHPPQDPVKSPMKSPKKTSKDQDAFYARLAKQETISSAAHHTEGSGSSQSIKSPKKVGKNSVYDRLYKQETAATKAHHVKDDPKESTKPLSPKKAQTPPPSLLKRLENKPTSPPIALNMKLHIRTKEEKTGGKSYHDLEITQADVRRQINLFQAGKISANAIAFDIINALFHRDFDQLAKDHHWEIGTAKLEELDPISDKQGGKVLIFQAEKAATLDYKDIYNVAMAKATIKVSSGEIYIDEHSYGVEVVARLEKE